MKDYEIKKASLLMKQNLHCKSCGKKFVESDKIELAHHLKASKDNYRMFGELMIDHELNLSATHSGNCNDACNCSRAANPVKATELLIRIIHEILCDDPTIFITSKLNDAFDNMIKIGKCKDITNLIVLSELDIIRKFFTKWKEL